MRPIRPMPWPALFSSGMGVRAICRLILVALIGYGFVVSTAGLKIAAAQPAAAETTESAPSVDDRETDTQSVTPDSAPSPDSAESDQGVADKADENLNAKRDSGGTGYLGFEKPTEEDESYFELLKLFADTLDQVERNYVEQVSRRELLEAAIQGVLSKLDKYSDYIPPDQFDRFRTGVENQFGGIGIRVGMIDGVLTVITPLYGTPAYRAGVSKDDQILKIDGASTEKMSMEDAISKMKGPIGSSLKLRVRHADDVEELMTMNRELVQMETVLGVRRLDDDRWEFMHDRENKIGYIRIKSFSGQTAEDLKSAVQQLSQQDVQALILDLRFNPGGMLTSAIEVTDTFLADGKIVSTAGRNTPERTWRATKQGTFEGFKMAILVNRYSASASEIVSAALQDHERAIVIGERTWGKGSVQNIIELEGGKSALKLTTASYMRPSGKNIDRLEDATDEDDWGVKPDDGFALRMSTDELRRLVQFQGDGEILYPRGAKERGNQDTYIDRHLQAALEHFNQP